MSTYYRVEANDDGCKHCGHEKTYDVVGPDDVAIGISYEDKDEADSIAELLDHAYHLGTEAKNV